MGHCGEEATASSGSIRSTPLGQGRSLSASASAHTVELSAISGVVVEVVVGDKTCTTDAKRNGLGSLNHLLGDFLRLSFVEIVLLRIIDLLKYFVLFHLGCLQRLSHAFKDVFLALWALIDSLFLQILRLIEFEQLLQAFAMNLMLAIVQKHAFILDCDWFGALAAVAGRGILEVIIRWRELLLKGKSAESLKADWSLQLLELKEHVIAFGRDLLLHQLLAHLFVEIHALRQGAAWRLDALLVGWLPVSIWRWPVDELMVTVIAALEAKLANLHFGANEALVFRLIQYLPLATCAPERTLRLHLRNLVDSHRQRLLLSLPSFLFQLFSHAFSVQLCRLFEVFEGVAAPASSTKWTADILPTRLLMLDPSLHALCVQIATATEFAIGKVLVFVHDFVADAAVFSFVQGPLLHSFLLLLVRVGAAEDVVDLVVYIPQPAIVLVDDVVSLLVQGSLGCGSACSATLCPHGVGIGTVVHSARSTIQDLLYLPIIE